MIPLQDQLDEITANTRQLVQADRLRAAWAPWASAANRSSGVREIGNGVDH
jgi:hypothetical protein